MQKILIIGGGRLGSTLKNIINQHQPIIWDIDPKVNESKLSLEDEAKNADIFFICTPTVALEDILNQIKKSLKKSSIVITFSKGLSKNGKFTFEILQSIFNNTLDSKQNYGVLAGPLMAEEIEQNLPTVGTLALKNNDRYLDIKKVFLDSPIRLNNSNDLKGLSIAGTLKNVYAILIGIVDELKLGENFKSVLITKSFREIKIISKSYGGKLTTLNSSAGLADLIVTSCSQYSDNTKCGRSITKNEKCECEGFCALPLLTKRIKNKQKLPLLSALEEIIKNPKNAKSILQSLLPN